MSTIRSVKNQLQTLINQANATTGRSDKNLTVCQQALVNGYGSGSGGVLDPSAKIYYIGKSTTELTRQLLRFSSTAV